MYVATDFAVTAFKELNLVTPRILKNINVKILKKCLKINVLLAPNNLVQLHKF